MNILKSLSTIALCLMLTACAGFSVEKYDVNQSQNFGDKKANAERTLPGVQFKTVEIYKHNAFGPSFNYVMLFACDEKGLNCSEIQRTPTTTPGFIASLIAPVIQAGAILGGAAILSDGIRHSGSSINNGSSSNSSASSKSKSHNSNTNVNANSNTNTNGNSNNANGGQGGQGGNGGQGGDGGNGGSASATGCQHSGGQAAGC